MTGPEHYTEAERILSAASQAASDVDLRANLMAAQVHATLALTAATVEASDLTKGGSLGIPNSPRWVKAVRP